MEKTETYQKLWEMIVHKNMIILYKNDEVDSKLWWLCLGSF